MPSHPFSVTFHKTPARKSLRPNSSQKHFTAACAPKPQPFFWLVVLAALMLYAAPAAAADRQRAELRNAVYRNAKAPVEQRVADLLSRMTLSEKIWQLTQGLLGNNDNPNNVGAEASGVEPQIGSVIYSNETPALRNAFQRRAVDSTRLGIPVLFGYDVIHGYRTLHPVPLAVSATFNPALASRAAHMAAVEGQAGGVDWTFSPMLDIARDARWGRITEGYGEDPFLASCFARAAVEGYQGSDLASTQGRMAACLKHYVGYGASEAGIDYAAAEISRQTLWDTYLPPFEEGIKAGAATVMAGFHDISGTPATANRYTLTEILKEQWGHEGFVVSDWTGVVQLKNQLAARDDANAAELALNAGVEMDMLDDIYLNNLERLVSEGRVDTLTINNAVRRILTVKFRLGLFEHPYTPEGTAGAPPTPEALALAEELAAESFVLLKNSNGLLPLKKNIRVAVMGPMARNREHLLGSWRAHGRYSEAEPLADGLRRELGSGVECLDACPFDGTDTTAFAAAAELARRSDVLVLCMGEKNRWSGENSAVANLELPAVQQAFVRAMKRTGRPVVLVLSSGRPMALGTLEPFYDALLEIWKPGLCGAGALAAVMSGRTNPSGRLSVTFPYSTSQVPIYYNRRRSARPTLGLYLDQTSRPLYPFGAGLSYTQFTYSKPRVTGRRVEVDVTNSGTLEGKETVMFFITAPAGLPTRPERELRHFEKRLIGPGKTETFVFDIDPAKDLSFPDHTGRKQVRPGRYLISVGGQQAAVDID